MNVGEAIRSLQDLLERNEASLTDPVCVELSNNEAKNIGGTTPMSGFYKDGSLWKFDEDNIKKTQRVVFFN